MDTPWIATAITLALLVAVAATGLLLFGVESPWSAALAVARAVVQLAVLSLVLAGIITNPVWVAVALGIMVIAAIATTAARSRTPARDWPALAGAVVAGPVVVGLIVFGTGALQLGPQYLLALGGIIIGNTMTIAILFERVYRGSVLDHWDEVEGWLALGATPRQSTRDLARGAVRTALLPSIDQTRTTGIVVLPGAFIGAIFAGASPLEAGRFQVVVLASVLAAGVIASVILAWRAGAAVRKPG